MTAPLAHGLRGRPVRRLRRLAGALAAAAACAAVRAAPGTPAASPPASPPGALPAAVADALSQAGIPPGSLAAWVQPVEGTAPALAWNADQPMNPASVFKLVTTTAALDLLGPAWRWRTPVWIDGRVRHGVLHGRLVLQGQGDPTLVMERVWLLLRQVRDAGVRRIDGDIVLDDQAFAPPARTPADFDGEPWRPYNVLPDALLLNYKSVTLTFVPDLARHVARVQVEPPLAHFRVPATVPLAGGACGDWRDALRMDPTDPGRWTFSGAYPAACGRLNWPVAYPDPATYDARLVGALWQELGGTLHGTVREGAAPADTPPDFVAESPALADAVREINKFSNNVMAEQVFLTLARERGGADAGTPATPARAREVLERWLRDRLGAADAEGTVIDRGSGLSRETRIRARTLAALLRWAEASPVAPELLSSLPIAGVDGTMRHATAAVGRAHLKTGSMRDVRAMAGEVLDVRGRRWVLVALVNDPRADGARPVLHALLDWVEQGAPAGHAP